MAIKDDMEDVQEAVINELITDNGLNPLTVGDGEITRDKILNGEVILAKLGSDVDLGQVNDDAVTRDKILDGEVTSAKLSQAYLPLTGGTVSGSLTTTSQTINNANQSQSAVSIGGSSTNAALVLRGSPASASAWQISTNAYVASGLEFTKSTAVGGTIFNSPKMVINSQGHVILSNVPTSSSGLSTGTIYSDGGTLKIV